MRLPRLLLAVPAAVACAALVWVALVIARDGRPAPAAEPPAAGHEQVVTALQALRQWDAGRARAWASADPVALRSLYAPRSAAGARDLRMLHQWRARGLRVEDMQTQVLGAEVVARSSRRIVLVVTDRLARAVAAGRGQRVVLPGDGVTTRRVTLRLVADVWRVASVLPQVPAEQSAQP